MVIALAVAGLVAGPEISAVDVGPAAVTPPPFRLEHLACETFVAGEAVDIIARVDPSPALFAPRVLYRFTATEPWRIAEMVWVEAPGALHATVETPPAAKRVEYFLEVFAVDGSGPVRVGSAALPLHLAAAAERRDCSQLPEDPRETRHTGYFGRLDLALGVLLGEPQTVMQEPIGGSVAGSAGLAIALRGGWRSTRLTLGLGGGYFGFPADRARGAAGVGFAAAGPGLAIPLDDDFDYVEVDARAGAGVTGTFVRGVYDLGVAVKFDLGWLALGPTLRYLQVLDGPEGTEGDAHVVLAGISLGSISNTDRPVYRAPELVTVPLPGLDRDADRILDVVDKCPDDPEDWDDDEDYDGCPEERDNDGDGVINTADPCPDQAEDRDGFQDEDGCPDPDNDGDGVLDPDDLCPLEAGPRESAGCPVRDRDGDGITDDVDECPDVPGNPPTGCPERVLVVKTDTAIEIKDKILFETAKAKIKGKTSFAILDQVAAVMKSNPGIAIRVEGHTDERAGPIFNQKLSQARAEAVRQALITRGIAPARLEAVGYGESRPIATGKTKKGLAANRRVEFLILHTEPPEPPPLAPSP